MESVDSSLSESYSAASANRFASRAAFFWGHRKRGRERERERVRKREREGEEERERERERERDRESGRKTAGEGGRGQERWGGVSPVSVSSVGGYRAEESCCFARRVDSGAKGGAAPGY